jgi:hypothetical protein
VRRNSNQMSGVFDWLWGKPKPEAQPAGPPPPIHVDLYDVLRIPPTASMDEIRTAFRDLARKFHPDVNPDDPLAERRFQEITTAYGILSNDAQRAAYDRMRAAAVPPRPPPTGLIIPPAPPGGRRAEEKREIVEKPKPLPVNIWEQVIGKPEGKAGSQDIVDIFSGRPRAPRIPTAEDPHAWATERAKRIPVSPGVDTPTGDELFQIISQWPLDGVWDVVRADRHSNAFRQAGAMAVDVIAGSEQQPAEWELSEMFHIPLRETDEFIRHRGRQAFFSEILFPIFNNVTVILGQLKPVDIPGQFFLDWDPKGKQIELIYAENAGRRP